jgi:3-hydroxyacyl-CoA dehydrogenase/enoyl-CoA hydratase/3-hydroxybutyryl-CoA epimerase
METDNNNNELYTEIDSDNIAWLHLDRKDSNTNVLSAAVLEAFYKEILDLTEKSPRGLIILSDKKNGFIAGADVHEFIQLKNQDEARSAIGRGQEVLDRLAALPFPTLALIHGFCLGGGLELALACRYRVACNDESTKLGLPEVRLGIHPGFGGSARIIPLIGAMHGMDLMLSGRSINARTAKRMGLIDYAVPERQMKTAARNTIMQQPTPHHPTKTQAMTNHATVRPILAKVFRNQVAKKAREDHYPAPYALIEIWKQHAGNERAMLHAEAESVSRLITGSTAQNLIRVFTLQEKMKDLGRLSDFKAKHVHVVGAGVMGGDIAAWCALRGMQVTLQDQSPERLAPAIKRAYQLFKRRLKRTRPIQEVMDRLMPDHTGLGIEQADVVIEAIFEDADAKRALYAELEPRMKPGAVLATNTSSIPLEELGRDLQTPNRLVGLHFFNPVAKMQLVEIVRDESTDQDVINRAMAFTRSIGRLPLPVSSSPGFLVNRILMPYLLEAVELENEGVPPAEIDRQAVAFGMPMGPIELADTVGLDICLHVGEILGEHLGVKVPERLGVLVNQGRLGRKSGQGFYEYKKGKAIKPKIPSSYHPSSDVTDRMVQRMLNEAVACLREKVVDDEDMLDGGMIFGTGFAPFRGGPSKYIETEGADVMLQRLHSLEKKYGERFKPDAGWESLSGFSKSEGE